MNDILKRSFAPLTDDAWAQIDQEATRTLKVALSGRTVVDVSGPHGWALGAVNLGRLHLEQPDPMPGVKWGTRQVQPLTEFRVPFALNLMELDDISRGSLDPDLEPLQEAAQKAAHFEDGLIYNGLAEAGIKGIRETSPHARIAITGAPSECVKAFAQGLKTLQAAGIGGPYALALAPDCYYALLHATEGGYPLLEITRNMVGGPITWSPVLQGGLLLSTRGGDFELTLGQDLSLGYAGHSRDQVELYLTESVTFRVIEPAAAVVFSGA